MMGPSKHQNLKGVMQVHVQTNACRIIGIIGFFIALVETFGADN
jgi:hypothetical protein